MHIVVTGGTGFIGQRLVRRLLAEGHEVTVVTRNASRAGHPLPLRCVLRDWSETRVEDVLQAADAVINLAGEGIAERRWTPDRKDAIRTSRVATTRTLVQALGALSPADRPHTLISASAIGYYGDRGDEELTEASASGADYLADVCGAWEREGLAATALGVRTVIVRIGVVLGKGGGALTRMLLPFRLGLGGRLGSGRQWMSWIHLDDLVDLLMFALRRSDVSGVLNGVAPGPSRNAEFTITLGRTLGRPTWAPVPAVVLRIALGEMSTILLGSQRVLPRTAERLAFPFRYPNLAGALLDLCRDHTHEIEYEQWVPGSPADVFPFFSNPYNLETITPDFLRFRVRGLTTPQLREGTRIDYRLALHGIPIRWQSIIDTWEPDRRFVDSQVKGPYKLWHHTHEFEPYNNGTLIRDRLRYELPLGPLGELIAGSWVARDVATIFAFRRKRLAEIFP